METECSCLVRFPNHAQLFIYACTKWDSLQHKYQHYCRNCFLNYFKVSFSIQNYICYMHNQMISNFRTLGKVQSSQFSSNQKCWFVYILKNVLHFDCILIKTFHIYCLYVNFLLVMQIYFPQANRIMVFETKLQLKA